MAFPCLDWVIGEKLVEIGRLDGLEGLSELSGLEELGAGGGVVGSGVLGGCIVVGSVVVGPPFRAVA